MFPSFTKGAASTFGDRNWLRQYFLGYRMLSWDVFPLMLMNCLDED